MRKNNTAPSQVNKKHLRLKKKNTVQILYSPQLNVIRLVFKKELLNLYMVCTKNGMLHLSNTDHKILAAFFKSKIRGYVVLVRFLYRQRQGKPC